jgi:hypothetical protein
MGKMEKIHVGFVLEYNPNKAIIHVLGKNYHVIPTHKEADFL